MMNPIERYREMEKAVKKLEGIYKENPAGLNNCSIQFCEAVVELLATVNQTSDSSVVFIPIERIVTKEEQAVCFDGDSGKQCPFLQLPGTINSYICKGCPGVPGLTMRSRERSGNSDAFWIPIYPDCPVWKDK